eukprot:2315510-Pleurochrysis_carterae.AAC.2
MTKLRNCKKRTNWENVWWIALKLHSTIVAAQPAARVWNSVSSERRAPVHAEQFSVYPTAKRALT